MDDSKATDGVNCVRVLDTTAFWTFKDVDILKSPNGNAVDNIQFGSVYVWGDASCNVAVISNNELFHKQVLSK